MAGELSWPDGWRLSWFVLAAAVLAIALFCWIVLRDTLQEMGLAKVIAEQTGNFSSSFLLAAAMTFLAVLISSRLTSSMSDPRH